MFKLFINSEKNDDLRVGRVVIAGIVAIFALVVILQIWTQGLGALKVFHWSLHHGATMLALGLIAVPITYFILRSVFNTDTWLPRAALIGVPLGIIVGIGLLTMNNYATAKQYSADVTTDDTTVTDYVDRAPWVVSDQYASRDQGEIIGDRIAVNYVPTPADNDAEDGDGNSRYTTLIKGRSAVGLVGYSGVQTLEMPTTGSIPNGASSYCSFPGDDSGSRLGAFFPTVNMNWEITAVDPLAYWDKDDAYAYCDGEDPVIVIPVYKYEGFFYPTKVPNGAMVYRDGEMKHLDSSKLVEEEISGPTYPRHIAEAQRNAINAGGSLADWWGKRYGFESTDKDQEDTNTGATSELTMVKRDGALVYMTPLTPRGSSSSLTAVAEAPAQQLKDGRLPVVVNTTTDLPATSNIATSIKESSVEGDSNWTNRWASGMTIYEIIPAQDGHWVASIGQGQAVSYRADISPEGTVVITNSDTGASGGQTVDGEEVTVTSDKPLNEMTDEELYDLLHEAADELERRNAEG